jgi:hypothetical protein
MKKICNTLIWLGAGTATNPSILFDEFERVIVIEARPEIKIEPDTLKPFVPKIEIHRVCLVSQDSNFKTFNVYNVEEVSSVNKPTGIYELYPNILKTAEETVEFEFVTEFLNDITFDKNTSVKLVVDIPDVSVSFLSDIIDSQVFDKVKQILLLAPRFKLFENSADLVELLATLEENVEMQYELDETDPDFPICHIEIEQSKFEKNRLTKLEIQLEKMNQELEENRESAELIKIKMKNADAEKQGLEEQLQNMSAQRDKQKTHNEENKAWAELTKQQLEVSEAQRLAAVAQQETANEKIAVVNRQIQQQATEIANSAIAMSIQEEKQVHIAVKLQEAEKTLGEKSQQIEQLETQASEELVVKSGIEELLQSMTAQRDKQKYHYEENKAWAESLKQKLEASEEQRLIETALQEKTGNELIEKSQQIEQLETQASEELVVKSGIEELLQSMTAQRDKQKHHHEENKAWAESLKQKLDASEEQRLAETALQEKTGNELVEKSQHIKKLQAEIEKSLAEKRVVDEQLINITVQRDKLLIEIQHKSNRLDEDAVVNTRKLNEANKRIDQMLTMQNMNVRMLQKSEADNANLRENIANKHDQIESMTALLTELHEKLKLASNFYEELTTQHPELIEKSVI